MSFMVPNLSALRSRALRQQADRLVAQIDLGRQRAVMTGDSHRLMLDLDAGVYWLESQGKPEPAAAAEGFEQASHLGDDSFLSLAPPPPTLREFEPLPGLMGREAALQEEVVFAGVETAGGWVERGEVWVSFLWDGGADFTTIVLDDGEGRRLSLEILPLADTVRVLDESS